MSGQDISVERENVGSLSGISGSAVSETSRADDSNSLASDRVGSTTNLPVHSRPRQQLV